MRKRLPLVMWLLGLCLLLVSCQPGFPDKIPPVAEQGELDLRNWNTERDGVITLDGEWEFYWQQLLKPEDFSKLLPEDDVTLIKFPGSWNKHQIENKPIGGQGYATYRLIINKTVSNNRYALKMLSMSSAYKLWINGNFLMENGKTAKNRKDMIPEYRPQIRMFEAQGASIELVLQISNFHHRRGGAWNSIQLGTEQQIIKIQRQRDFLDMFLFGAILVIGVYHLVIFAMQPKEKSTLFFGLYCITICSRSLFYSQIPIQLFFPLIEWEHILLYRYLLSFLTIPIFALFIKTLYFKESSKAVLNAFIYFQATIIIITLLSPSSTYSYIVKAHEASTLLFVVYIVYILTSASLKKNTTAKILLFGAIPYAAFIINDVLANADIINSIYLIPIGLLFFLLSQAFLIARNFYNAFVRVEELKTFYRNFLPSNFLSALEQNDITKIKLGDCTEKNISVLFADIRGFTKLSNSMTPEQNFLFINLFLKEMEPIIFENNGFIDKYTGDGIMALFENKPDDAIRTAIAMLENLRNNKNLTSYPTINIGIGINTGKLMLGVIGGSVRLDVTVIGNTVNIASKIESMTKVHNSPILISEHTYKSLDNPSEFYIRYIGDYKKPEMEEEISIYEIFDIDDIETKKGKVDFSDRFSLALEKFYAHNFTQAHQLFERYLTYVPNDTIAMYYLKELDKK